MKGNDLNLDTVLERISQVIHSGMRCKEPKMKIMRSTRLNIFIAISVLVPLIILSQAGGVYARQFPSNKSSKESSSGATAGFVTRSKTRLMLNGQAFRFAGANIHWLALDDSTLYPSQFRVKDALDAAKEMGLTVIRSHDLGISTGCPNCIEPSLGVFNETALEHVDYVLKAAADRGLRLIIPLTDNWHYPAGGKHNFTDWRGISDENQFYYNLQVISDFEAYVSTLLNRVNIYTGIAYKNDPTILAWETGNELQPPTKWTQTISTYIKGIDPNHLVIDGRAGIDPNAASVTNVDMLSNHYYPKSIASMTADASAAAIAGKAFIVGEFDWNDANGGSSLSDFLSSIQSNPEVTGDAFWELWSHDDQYGYDSGDEYTLHYPGDTAAMRKSVALLRQYAYKMSNQALPPDNVPGIPLLKTAVRNGTSNTLIWQGTAIAASYTIQHSTSGPNGPWSVICNRCATDNDTPWVDTQVPPGPLWYRVIAYNVSGVAGSPTNSYQAGSASIMIDKLNNWSHVYQRSSHLIFDTTNSQYMGGDTSRAVRTTATHEFITWKQANMVSFQAISYFWPAEPVSAFSIYTSADGKNWTPATPQIVSIYGDWPEYIYTLQGLSNTNYVKMVWNNLTGQTWNPNLGAVSIL